MWASGILGQVLGVQSLRSRTARSSDVKDRSACSKIFTTIVAASSFLAAGSIITIAVADDASVAAPSAKLATGLTPLAQLLQLMDTDKNGKVSKKNSCASCKRSSILRTRIKTESSTPPN